MLDNLNGICDFQNARFCIVFFFFTVHNRQVVVVKLTKCYNGTVLPTYTPNIIATIYVWTRTVVTIRRLNTSKRSQCIPAILGHLK